MKISDDDIEITKKLKNYTPSNKLPKLELSNSFIEGMLDKINESFALGDADQTTGDILQLVSEACEDYGLSELSVCQRGCAHCCKIPVNVTAMEARYIGGVIGVVPTNVQVTDEDLYDYCPFLNQEKAECSIYEHRPIECRTFHSVDHYKYCEQGSTHHHQISTSSTPFFSQMRQTVTDSSNGVVADIRSWFPSGKNG